MELKHLCQVLLLSGACAAVSVGVSPSDFPPVSDESERPPDDQSPTHVHPEALSPAAVLLVASRPSSGSVTDALCMPASKASRSSRGGSSRLSNIVSSVGGSARRLASRNAPRRHGRGWALTIGGFRWPRRNGEKHGHAAADTWSMATTSASVQARFAKVSDRLNSFGYAIVDGALGEHADVIHAALERLEQRKALRQHRFGFKADASAPPRVFIKPNIFEAELQDDHVRTSAHDLVGKLAGKGARHTGGLELCCVRLQMCCSSSTFRTPRLRHSRSWRSALLAMTGRRASL